MAHQAKAQIENIGPESSLYFKRLEALKALIIPRGFPRILPHKKFAGFDEYVSAVQCQTGVSLTVAEYGVALAFANEKLSLFDPLTVPILN